MATSIGQYPPVFLPGEPPSLTEKPGRPQSTGSQRVRHDQSDPVCIDARGFIFWPVAALPQCSLCVKVAQLIGLWRPWQCQVFRDMDFLCQRSYGPIRVFFRASCSWQSEGLFGQSFSIALPIQALKRASLPGFLLCCSVHQAHRGTPLTGVLLCNWHIRHLMGHTGWGPTL